MPDTAFDVLCVTLWMVLWWVTGVILIAVTALLPIVLFTLTGALEIEPTTAAFGHKYVFLYLDRFILAAVIERWILHKRIALSIINLIGTNVKLRILGFMLATAFLSMWISNTATSVVMLPIEMAIITQLKVLRKIGTAEKRVFVIFTVTAFLWISRSFLLQQFIPFIDDMIIAMAAAIVIFTIPAGEGKAKFLSWEEAVKIPWGIILLFGGGMALAKGYSDTGLAIWIGEQLIYLQHLSLFLLVLILVSAVNFLTEITSNLATTAMLLPILAPMALAIGCY